MTPAARAVAASLSFAPEIVALAPRFFERLKLRENNIHGFNATLNATLARGGPLWISSFHVGVNQGPPVLMIDNYRWETL